MDKVSEYVKLLASELNKLGYSLYNGIVIPTEENNPVIFITASNFKASLTLPLGKIHTKEGNVLLTISFPMKLGEGNSNVDTTYVYDEIDAIIDLIIQNPKLNLQINNSNIIISYIHNISPSFNKNRIIGTVSYNIIL